MRSEEYLNDHVARFTRPGPHGPRVAAPHVSPEIISEGLARGRRLHARSCRQAARALIVAPTMRIYRFMARAVIAAAREIKKDRLRRETIRKLEALDDRLLRDIGVERSNIHSMARALANTDAGGGPTPSATSEPTPEPSTFVPAQAA